MAEPAYDVEPVASAFLGCAHTTGKVCKGGKKTSSRSQAVNGRCGSTPAVRSGPANGRNRRYLDLPTDPSSGDTATVADSMVPDLLTGNPGVSPLSWLFLDGEMTAIFNANAFIIGDVSDVLWFTSPLPPELGGPLGLGADNGFFSADGALLLTNNTLAPIPEPSSVILLASGVLLGVACFKPLRTRRDA